VRNFTRAAACPAFSSKTDGNCAILLCTLCFELGVFACADAGRVREVSTARAHGGVMPRRIVSERRVAVSVLL
jgi:hypothetical protein